jgi:hypothetical protein
MDRRMSFMERGSEYLCDGCPNDLGDSCAWNVVGFPSIKNSCAKREVRFEERIVYMKQEDKKPSGTVIVLPDNAKTAAPIPPAVIVKPEIEFTVFSAVNAKKMIRYAYLP